MGAHEAVRREENAEALKLMQVRRAARPPSALASSTSALLQGCHFSESRERGPGAVARHEAMHDATLLLRVQARHAALRDALSAMESKARTLAEEVAAQGQGVLAAAEEHRGALEEYTRGERRGGGWEGAWEALRGSVREIDVKLYAKLVASADRDASSARVCKRLKLHAPRGRAGARVGGADRGSGEEPLRGALSPRKWTRSKVDPPPNPTVLHADSPAAASIAHRPRCTRYAATLPLSFTGGPRGVAGASVTSARVAGLGRAR
jgi:hypothetical protein